ncbi:MAG: hypothetical protein ACR2JC_09430 [Chloroflexota bacterium]
MVVDILLFIVCCAVVASIFVIYGWATQRADASGLRGISRAWGASDTFPEDDQRNGGD